MSTINDEEAQPFQSARLTYRALEPEDEQFVHDLESDPKGFINSQLALKKPWAKKDSKKHFDWLNNCLLAVIISETATNSPIGILNLPSLESELVHHRHTELGLGLLPGSQGKGYGSEAILWALQGAFEHGGLHRVSVKAFEYNGGARRLYERLGFVHERTAREAFWHNGRWWADYEYAMLEGEWRDKKTKASKREG